MRQLEPTEASKWPQRGSGSPSLSFQKPRSGFEGASGALCGSRTVNSSVFEAASSHESSEIPEVPEIPEAISEIIEQTCSDINPTSFDISWLPDFLLAEQTVTLPATPGGP